MNLSYLSVSNGSGDAVLMHVMAARPVNATTIDVDSVINVPAQFIGTMGTPLSNGLINPATKTDFFGHLASGALIIDSFAPGNPDQGSLEGDIVVIKPNTAWANMVATVIQSMRPVGSLYYSTVATNPATVLGFGTWTPFAQGQVVVGAGTSDATYPAGQTGGESNHTLTTGEMPAHVHTLPQTNNTPNGAGNITQVAPNANEISNNSTTSSNGGGGAHNNMPPYVVAYCWQRTA